MDYAIILIMGRRERFQKIYNNLPLNLRLEVVLVIGGEPVTWNVIWLEVEQRTKIGERMLEKLEALKII